MHGLLADDKQFTTGVAIILANMFKARSAVNAFAMVQLQEQSS